MTAMLAADYHVHTRLSDGEGEAGAYVERAAAAGLTELGFTDHLVPEACDQYGYGISRVALDGYVAGIRAQNGRFPGLQVLVGVEIDYTPDSEQELGRLLAGRDFDYVIGSVHFVDEFGFDITLLRDDPRWRDVDHLYRRYWETMRDAVLWGRFDVVGHLDLPKKFGYRPTRSMEAVENEALAAIKEAGLALEVNTSGLRHPVGELYPAVSLLARAGALGIPVTFGSDAHRPADVGRDFEAAIALAQAAGYRRCLRLSDRSLVDLP